ncbi:MAG: type II secretion system major pseudopilin GspG [Candidatus Omnitrophica bacterium]|nr:type II secretion system major pseudopilin GspG [Candidatus Omnitrophota bacterium]
MGLYLLNNHNRKAFTLVEIMLVVIIIAALSAMVIPRLAGRSEQAKVSVARSDIEAHLSTALKLYELDNGTFPTTAQGLSALREKPNMPPVPDSWNGPYIEKDPVDPWGNPYVYSSPGKNRPDYDLFSKGKDSASETDDITNWK